MNKYCATFHTHYGAIKFNKICARRQIEAKLMPVPRKISSSCTTCVFFSAPAPDAINDSEIEDLDECFLIEGQEYKKL